MPVFAVAGFVVDPIPNLPAIVFAKPTIPFTVSFPGIAAENIPNGVFRPGIAIFATFSTKPFLVS